MTTQQNSKVPPSLRLGWLVVANATRARVFERDDDNGTLREIADLVHPDSRIHEADRGRDRPGSILKGTVGTAFEPHTDPRARERAQFAREVCDMLERAALEHRMPALVLMASNPFLGELTRHLGSAAQGVLRIRIPVDLTSCQHGDLEHRVSKALRAHVPAAPTGPSF